MLTVVKYIQSHRKECSFDKTTYIDGLHEIVKKCQNRHSTLSLFYIVTVRHTGTLRCTSERQYMCVCVFHKLDCIIQNKGNRNKYVHLVQSGLFHGKTELLRPCLV